METTYAASLLNDSSADNTFYTVTGTPAPSPLPTTLSSNYPADSSSGSNPNPENQAYFKSQTLTWWVSNLNSGNVHYYPFSNEVNWAYFPDLSDKNTCFHIAVEITNVIIPNMTDTTSRNPPTGEESGRGSVVITMRPNNCLRMTVTRPGF
jgi:hypothetical protein